MTPIVITAVEATMVALDGPDPFRISEGSTRTHHSVVLRLLTNEPGLEGYGEVVSAPPGKPEEIHEEILGAIRRIASPALIGVPIRNRRQALLKVGQVLKGRIWTKAAIDNALHDVVAKSLGIPVHDLLGGRVRESVAVIGPVIGIDDPGRMAERAAAQAASGFVAVKIKIGEERLRDTERVRAVREAIGPNVALRVDANDHYQPAEAIRLIRAIERFEPEHVEQPVGRYDLLGMAAVQGAVGVPIMTDDAVATPQDAATVIRLGAAQRIKVKVTKHGLSGARLILDMAEAAGLGGVLGHVFELGLAAAAEAQLALASPNLILPCEIGSLRPIGIRQDIVEQDLFPEPGFLRVPAGPGLGVTLDRGLVAFRAAA